MGARILGLSDWISSLGANHILLEVMTTINKVSLNLICPNCQALIIMPNIDTVFIYAKKDVLESHQESVKDKKIS